METTNRNKIVLYSFDCHGCGKCVRKCPNNVLKIVDNGRCKIVNVANADACTGCRKCEQACLHHAIKIVQ